MRKTFLGKALPVSMTMETIPYALGTKHASKPSLLNPGRQVKYPILKHVLRLLNLSTNFLYFELTREKANDEVCELFG